MKSTSYAPHALIIQPLRNLHGFNWFERGAGKGVKNDDRQQEALLAHLFSIATTEDGEKIRGEPAPPLRLEIVR
jgi:hypothetical protein